MTAEKRITISPHDIISVGWECPHCHALYAVPIEKLDRPLVIHCPNCNQRLAGESQPSTEKHSDSKVLQFFLEFLSEMKRRPFGKDLRFELGGEVKLDTKQ
jgi:transcription elongation factor Elf1